MIILDTDVMVDLLRGLPQAIAWFNNVGDEEAILPGFVMMELIQGCRTKAELRNLRKQVQGMSILWPTQEDCDVALTAYADYHFVNGIGMLDALVGQLAASLDTPLYTFNQKHYAGISGLVTLQPYIR